MMHSCNINHKTCTRPCNDTRSKTSTVEPALKDHPTGHENILSRQVVFGDRFIYTEMYDFLPKARPSSQVVSHGSGLSRQVSLYQDKT